MVFISIIMPVLNEEELLEKCLQSLTNQTRPADEIIVIDGGSTDRSIEIAQRYTDKVYSSSVANIGAQRQQGLELAKGEIVISTDADALYPVDFVEKLVTPLNDENVTGSFCKIEPMNKSIISDINCFARNNLFRPLLNRGVCFAFKKEYSEGGFDPVNYGEFDNLKKSLSKYGKIVYEPKAVVTTDIPQAQLKSTLLLVAVPSALAAGIYALTQIGKIKKK